MTKRQLKEIIRNVINESISDDDYNTYSKNFINFTTKLKALSLKYGIVIQSVGGVMYSDPSDIKSLKYSSDLSSGDLIPDVDYYED